MLSCPEHHCHNLISNLPPFVGFPLPSDTTHPQATSKPSQTQTKPNKTSSTSKHIIHHPGCLHPDIPDIHHSSPLYRLQFTWIPEPANSPQMPPKKLKPSSTDSPWLRCPRSPCLVSYHPRNARQHLATCRYFSCVNEPCNFLGTSKQVNNHESSCPYALRSEEIGTTDPLSDSPSEVLDILTSPTRVNSYPTEPSSGVSPASSHKKTGSNRQRIFQSESPSVCDGSPVQGSSKLAKTKRTIPSDSAITTRLRGRPAERRSTLDPYDPSAKRIFSLPDEAIHPVLKPAPPRPLKSSSPVPPPPTRRLATYELQRYRPETRSLRARPSSTDTKPSPQDEEHLGLSEALAHKTAQLDALKDCYSTLVKSFDDIAYSISQNKAAHELQEELGRVPLDDFDRVLDELAVDNVPERAFLDDIVPANAEFKHDEDDFGPAEEVGGDKENARRSATLRPNSPAHSSSAGYDPHELLTTDELADQVRLKIAGSESKSSPLADSPSNVFGRKRKRLSPSTIPPYHPSSSSPSSSHPTRFIHKLADTTLDLGDEIQPGLPSCCNFNKLIQAARDRIQTRLELRNSRLNSSSSPSSS
ncbi:hypothetical protein PGT21_031629 [Puccinia graminis f. sp. tritici]|uniref:Uncharacterized protein n=1 Tax=Puccinia graminis f. sp. tritici TaxID=56615 RepID=A0A5B0LRL4_PUCGR|nr:hypothetical protein PGT21_031629 [Puccinia graminis f. sp. tritici]KAA1081903.1 hypothetical protein PGTUg99_027320 [Puccinia graminis f. sp. tritici]